MNLIFKIVNIILLSFLFSSCVANKAQNSNSQFENSGLYKYNKEMREYEYGTLKN
jgi:hypothetical protein